MTKRIEQDHGLDAALDNTLIQLCEGALLDGDPVSLELPVRNVNRTVGTMLGSLVTRRYGPDGLGRRHHRHHLAWLGRPITRCLPAAGGADPVVLATRNDYVGKGLSGGVIAVQPDERAPLIAQENVIAGNVDRLRCHLG